jgi:hypothetical protein
MNKIVVFSMGGKEGTGKTVAMTALAEYYLDNNVLIEIADCCTEENKTGCLNNFFDGVHQINIQQSDGLNIFTDFAVSKNDVLCVDLGGGIHSDFISWFNRIYSICSSYNISFLALGSVTSNPDSLDSIFKWGETLQKNVSYILVKNLFLGETKIWDKSTMAEKFIELFTPKIITLKSRSNDWQSDFEYYGLTLTKAMKSSLPKFSKISAQCRLYSWKKQIFKEFDSIKETLMF